MSTFLKASPRLGPAMGLSAALTLLAFGAGVLLNDSGFLSTIPPASPDIPQPGPDVAEAATSSLYIAAFTAWAALLVFIPSMMAFCLHGSSDGWRNLWTAAFLAFAIHMAWSVFVFFGGDMARLMASTRVSAPIPGFILLIWWAIDVALAWLHPAPKRLITIQRVIIHIIAFVLFVGGSAATGETLPIKLIGVICFVAVTMAAVKGWRGRNPAS